MNPTPAKISFHVEIHRVDAHASRARCKSAEIALDTELAGTPRRK